MKKKIRFDEIKVGGYFKRYRCIYMKIDFGAAIDMKSGREIYLYYEDNVIPVTVTIKVKEN